MDNLNLNLPANELYHSLVAKPLPVLKNLHKDFDASVVRDLGEARVVVSQVFNELEQLEINNSSLASKLVEHASDLILEKVFDSDLKNTPPNERERALNEFGLVAHEYLWANPEITLQDLMDLEKGSPEVAVRIVHILFP